MTKIDSITYSYGEAPTIRMDNGTNLPEPIIAHLANTRAAHEETYDATLYMEAAWNAAHPIPETVTTIPAGTPLIARTPKGISFAGEGYNFSAGVNGPGEIEYRTITPLPEPELEPWETTDHCYANGSFYKRLQDTDGNYWRLPTESTRYRREYLAKLNPQPVTIGEA